MKDLPIHILLFLISGAIVVAIGALFAEPEDDAALALLPRRLLGFFLGSAIVVAVMLICEHTFAAVS